MRLPQSLHPRAPVRPREHERFVLGLRERLERVLDAQRQAVLADLEPSSETDRA